MKKFAKINKGKIQKNIMKSLEIKLNFKKIDKNSIKIRKN